MTLRMKCISPPIVLNVKQLEKQIFTARIRSPLCRFPMQNAAVNNKCTDVQCDAIVYMLGIKSSIAYPSRSADHLSHQLASADSS